jgi:hypothetical protein
MWLWIILGAIVAAALVFAYLTDRRSKRLRGSVPEYRTVSRADRQSEAAKYGDISNGGGPA